jgi:phosphoribosylanthranilate isomerase
MKLKVCGMKYPENIIRVADVHPDYLGFIFYKKSPRAADCPDPEIIRMLRGMNIEPVAVFVDENPEVIRNIAANAGFNTLQLHGNESPAFCMQLKESGFKIIKAIPVASPVDIENIGIYEGCCDYLLFDTKTEAKGGSGKKFDWNMLDSYKGNIPFFLSGGIGLADALEIKSFNHPQLHAIDINSRFETSPAIKNACAIHIFKDFLKI